jgi:hypothetical protein
VRLATLALVVLACSSPKNTTVVPTPPTPKPVAVTAPSEFTDNAGLLRYLRARMTAPTGVWGRVARAGAVVIGTVTRSDVIPHEASAAFLTDPAVQSLAIEVGGKRHLFVSVVEIAVERWLAGPGGAGVTGVWLTPMEMTSESVTLPLVGTHGVVTLDALPATTLGRELANSVPGAYEIVPLRPLVIPQSDELVAAIGSRGAEPSHEQLARLAAMHGGALQVALGRIASSRDARASEPLRARVRADDTSLDTLLVRAALFDLGDRDAALAGWQILDVRSAVLDELGIVIYERGSGFVLVGPSSDTPLPWES